MWDNYKFLIFDLFFLKFFLVFFKFLYMIFPYQSQKLPSFYMKKLQSLNLATKQIFRWI